ncbi:MAG: amidophosphoribosyltransferase [Verrucomicrobiales bacterium]|nr:amidophosphoribosyltransferase [Verrucomicrobiales bacterium]
MGDFLKHECGIAVLRLKKPLAYYHDKYGSALYGFQKLFLLMEKQHNRGHDGIGIGCVKLNMELGDPYMFRERSAARDSLTVVFKDLMDRYHSVCDRRGIDPEDPYNVSRYFDFGGEILLGHLRYGTSGEFEEGSCHPFLRRSNWETRSLMVLGNFNMANAPELNRTLVDRGQHPVFGTDTQTVLEEIGFFLDQAHQNIYRRSKASKVPGTEIPGLISDSLHMPSLLKKAAKIWDGGYAIAGAVGNGDAFVMRDPNGIRPAFYFENDDFIGFASERVPLMTVFGLEKEEVSEVPAGHVVSIKNTGEVSGERFAGKRPQTPCSFERIYFSRGNDPEIYRERKELGRLLSKPILKAIDYNFRDTVFSFIPNTADVAYHGMMGGLREYQRDKVKKEVQESLADGNLDEKKIDDLILHNWPRSEKIAHKDIKMRTFISQEKGRKQLVSHVYDISYGVVEPGESLVVIDDSIVRGTTLRESILKILARTDPKKIVVVSSAPQIRYPDCYGIDMSELGKFIAFQAAIDLLKNSARASLIAKVYDDCREELSKPVEEMRNCVRDIYEPFTAKEISKQIARLVYPQDIKWSGEVEVIYQSIENLRAALGQNCGDWYFTGNYPTPAGTAVVNRAFIQYCDGIEGRPYDLGL